MGQRRRSAPLVHPGRRQQQQLASRLSPSVLPKKRGLPLTSRSPLFGSLPRAAATALPPRPRLPPPRRTSPLPSALAAAAAPGGTPRSPPPPRTRPAAKVTPSALPARSRPAAGGGRPVTCRVVVKGPEPRRQLELDAVEQSVVGGAEPRDGGRHVGTAMGARGPGCGGGGGEGWGGGGASGCRQLLPSATLRPSTAPSEPRLPVTPVPGGRSAASCALIGGLRKRRGGAEGFAQRYWLRVARPRLARGAGARRSEAVSRPSWGRARAPGSEMAAGAASLSHPRWPARETPEP